MQEVHTKKQYPKYSTHLKEDITDESLRPINKQVLNYVCHFFYRQIKGI